MSERKSKMNKREKRENLKKWFPKIINRMKLKNDTD
jgi:hypothetical protein